MNLQLSDTFANQQLPSLVEACLYELGSFALTARFNRKGTMLGVGCNNGKILLWDFLTRSLRRSFEAHSQPVTGISWSRNGRQVLSSSKDGFVVLWDVVSEDLKAIHRFQCGAPVLSSLLHPRNADVCIVTLLECQPQIITLSTSECHVLPVELPSEVTTDGQDGGVDADVDADASGAESEGRKRRRSDVDSKRWGSAVTFSRLGDLVYAGTSDGHLLSINSLTLEVQQSACIKSGISIKALALSRNGRTLLTSCADRILRTVDVQSFAAKREFQDAVNRLQWATCTFSQDGEYVIAGSVKNSKHTLYFWNAHSGFLEKEVEGPKEGTNVSESWAAYAPNFVALQENEEYIEREDEFDEIEEDSDAKRRQAAAAEAAEAGVEVDILTEDKLPGWSTDEEDNLDFLLADPSRTREDPTGPK